MTSKLETLTAKSEALAGVYSEEALAAHEALRKADPDNEVAGNRCGITLMKLERLEEAEAVFASMPDNPIAQQRLVQVRRVLARPPKPAKKPRKTAARRTKKVVGPTYWIKSLHFDESWTVAAGEESWIADIGRHDAAGKRVYRNDGEAWGEPTWKVGDEIGLYFADSYKVPALVEVIGACRFDPDFVSEHGGGDVAGERYPWVTPVRGVLSVPLAEAPTLTELGVTAEMMQRRPRFAIHPDFYERLRTALEPA